MIEEIEIVETKRRQRIHHRYRVIKSRAKRVRVTGWGLPSDKNTGWLDKNNCVCSCWMCGNPRKVFKGRNQERLTRKERMLEPIDVLLKEYIEGE